MIRKLLFLTYLIVTCSAVSLQPIRSFTDGSGYFCTKVHPTSPAPEYLNSEQRLVWYSKPSMILEMYVETNVDERFIVRTTAVKISSSDLTLGTHDVQAYNTTTSKKIHKLDVYLDNEYVPPNIQEKKYGSYNSVLSSIKVFYKGPLEFKWNTKCEDAFFGLLIEFEEPSTKTPSKESKATTKMQYYITEADAMPTTVSENDEAGADKITYIIAGSVVAGAVALIVVVVIIILVCKKKSQKHKHMKMIMSTKAEQNKQAMIHDAKRLSYQEQIKWTNSTVEPGVMYYPNR